nr:unnamed protein product [Digitaria exilis]
MSLWHHNLHDLTNAPRLLINQVYFGHDYYLVLLLLTQFFGVPLTLERASPSRLRPAALEGRRTGNSVQGLATHSFHDMMARLCGKKEESLHHATVPRRGEDTGQIRSPQTGYCANYSMTLSVPDTPQASGKDPRRTTGRARHHPHPRVTSLEATPELEGAIPARIVHGVGSTVHLTDDTQRTLTTFSTLDSGTWESISLSHLACNPLLRATRKLGATHHCWMYGRVARTRINPCVPSSSPQSPHRIEWLAAQSLAPTVGASGRGLRCATSASFPMGDFDHRRFPERSSDPFPAGYEICFGSLQFHATGNGYLMRILSKEPRTHPEASQPPRRPGPRARRACAARRVANANGTPPARDGGVPRQTPRAEAMPFLPTAMVGRRAAPAPPNLYGLLRAYDDLPGHHLVSVRNLIASTPDDSYPESGEEYALGQEFPRWDYSGLRDREAFLAFQAVADYFFDYSDNEYDPTRECFAIDAERISDGHTTDDDDNEGADPVGTQPPDLQDRSPQGDEPRSHHQAQDTHANELDANAGRDADARQAERVARARILIDGGSEDPVTLPRASQKLIAVVALLRAMPQPTTPEGRKLHREAQTLVEDAARQQAESSASRLRHSSGGVLGTLPSAKQRDATIARSNGGARHEDPYDLVSGTLVAPSTTRRQQEEAGARQPRHNDQRHHDRDGDQTTEPVGTRAFSRSIRMAPIPPRFRQPTTITKYSGETDPRVWLNNYRLACQLGGATDDAMIIRNLPLHLANSARMNTWDLRGCKQKPSESLRDFIRCFSNRCTELPNITDAQIIHSFLESTTSYNLICKLGRNPPPNANRLFEVASKYASWEEEADAIFNGKKGKHPDNDKRTIMGLEALHVEGVYLMPTGSLRRNTCSSSWEDPPLTEILANA